MKCELDLTYINDRLIAVSFPSFGLDDVYRHGILEVMKMLQSRHIDKYQIINVSERRYDILQVTEKGQVLNYGWPDHLAPPLQTLHQIIKALHLWLLADLKNVAVLHCKGGTSRIGMVIASYIQFSKNTPNPQKALEWFALRHYYDTKLEGAALPSQKRYVHYFGEVYEKKLKITNRRLYLKNINIHGLPYCGNGSGMTFYLKVYQSYHLCYITKNYTISSPCDRFSVTIDEHVGLQGDIMVKCLYRRGENHHLIFRLQFSTDAVDGCVAAFGKYDLDRADKDNRFPENCFVELLFAPGQDQEIESNQGVLDMERQMRGMVESNGGSYHVAGPVDGNPYATIDHTLRGKCRPSPSTAASKIDASYDLSRGIEDLEDLLLDLGHVGTTIDTNNNNTTCKSLEPTKRYDNNNNYISDNIIDNTKNDNRSKINHRSNNDMFGRNNVNCVPDSKVSSIVDGQLAEESYVKFPRSSSTCTPPNMKNNSESNNNISNNNNNNNSNSNRNNSNNSNNSRHSNNSTPIGVRTSLKDDDVFTESPTVNDLLFILDKPTSTSRCRNFTSSSSSSSIKKSPKLSAYDNMDDSFYSTSSEIDNTSLEAALEIHPGMVKQLTKSLSLKIQTNDGKVNAPKNGVPLPGIISPSSFRDAPTYNNNATPLVLSSTCNQRDLTNKKMEVDVGHQGHHYYSRCDGLRATESCDYSHIHNDEDSYSKRSTLLSRSDSAYGESMRSSSSSPPLITPCTPRLDNSYIHEEEDVSRKDICCSGESYSPKSDGLNEISSGIASRTSSMTSLDSSGDSKHGYRHQDNSTTLGSTDVQHQQHQPHHHQQQFHHHQQQKQHQQHQQQQYGSRSSVDTTDGATQTSPAPGETPSYSTENGIRATSTTINDEHSLNTRTLGEMKIPLNNNSAVTTPRGILKTMDISDHHHHHRKHNLQHNNDDTFTKGTSMQPHHYNSTLDTRSTGRSTSSLDDFGIHIVDQPVSTFNNVARKSSVGSSTGSEGGGGGGGGHSPRSTGSQSGSIGGGCGKQTTRRSMRSRGGSASSNSSISSNELFHEIVRNPSVKFDKETMSLWYKPKISREEATALLRETPPGSFVVRDSQSFEGGFGLAVKVETPPSNVLNQVGGDITKLDYNNELVRHYLIEPCKKGVRLKGSSNETAFPSLMALIYQHSLTRMSLPIELVIPMPLDHDAEDGSTLTEAEILEKGACCNLVYLGGIDVESLTGDGAIHYAMNKVTSAQNMQAKTTTVNIKVNHKGITLTDNQRRIFFRRHYMMKDVLHCGIDPKGRKINLKTLIDDGDREVECFGFVVKKETQSMITLAGNECHICAEMDPNQPASAVINFIHKAMRYSKV